LWDKTIQSLDKLYQEASGNTDKERIADLEKQVVDLLAEKEVLVSKLRANESLIRYYSEDSSNCGTTSMTTYTFLKE